jgi:hypothetical protein
MNSPSPAELTRKVMVGGAAFQKSFQEWTHQSSNLYYIVTASLLITTALFADKLSPIARAQLNTTLGRALLLVGLFLITKAGGWVLGVIGLVAVALVLSPHRESLPTPSQSGVKTAPTLFKGTEGFTADVVAVREVPTKHRWFVEKVFDERPTRIEEDRVLTQAAND